jgi:hypothetical protein
VVEDPAEPPSPVEPPVAPVPEPVAELAVPVAADDEVADSSSLHAAKPRTTPRQPKERRYLMAP